MLFHLLLNKRNIIPKRQSREIGNNRIHNTKNNKTKTQHNESLVRERLKSYPRYRGCSYLAPPPSGVRFYMSNPYKYMVFNLFTVGKWIWCIKLIRHFYYSASTWKESWNSDSDGQVCLQYQQHESLPLTLTHWRKKDGDIWRWKSRFCLGTGTAICRG